jgi:5-methyltetrahydrofolate--homocysteine methyltransferase
MKKKEIDCFAKYFRPEGDTLAVQAVTIGRELSNKCEQFFKEDDRYSDGFYLNAIGSLLTETIADKVTAEIRRGLAIADSEGKRYSFGYNGMCELDQQVKLFEIMSIEERLGIVLTEGFQMIPEHSTVGLFTAFPNAQYF